MANNIGWGQGADNNLIGWGQGALNAIGWGSSYLNSNSGGTNIYPVTYKLSTDFKSRVETDSATFESILCLISTLNKI